MNKIIMVILISFILVFPFHNTSLFAAEWFQTLENDFNKGITGNLDINTNPDQIQLAVKKVENKIVNLLGSKNGTVVNFFPSEYTKSFDNGPGQFVFVNDGITDSDINKELGYQPSVYLSDDLSSYSNPFPQEFIFRLPQKESISSFILYNGPGSDAGGANSEIKKFRLYYNNDVVAPDDVLSIDDDGGGWCYKGVMGKNIVFEPLSPKNIFGDIPFASQQNKEKFLRNTWIQSKDMEFNLNRESVKWVRINFKKPIEISSIFIMSDDGANIDNLETDIFNLEIIVHSSSYGDESVYDNSENGIINNDYSKGFWKIFRPTFANAVTIKFHTNKYIEWQSLLIFKSSWKEFFSGEAEAKDGDYSPQVFRFNLTEPFQYLRISVESNHGNNRWLSFGEIEAYSYFPQNIASLKNGRAKIISTNPKEEKLSMSLLNDEKITYHQGFNFGWEKPGMKKYAILDLGGRKTFHQIVHWNCGWYGAKKVTIYSSMDQENWEKIGTYSDLNLTRPKTVNKDIFIFEPISARYLKFEYDPESWNSYVLRISEYEVFSTPVEYFPSGLYASPVLDCKKPVKFEYITFNQEPEGDIPQNTSIEIIVKSGVNNNLSGTLSVSSLKFQDNNVPKVFNFPNTHTGNQFFQYLVKLNSNVPLVTPVFSDFSLIYKTPEELYNDANFLYDIEKFDEALKIINTIMEKFTSGGWLEKAAIDLKTAILLQIDKKSRSLFEKANQEAEKNNLELALRILQTTANQYPTSSIINIIQKQIDELKAQRQYIDLIPMMVKNPDETIIKFKELAENFPKTKWGIKAQEKFKDFFEEKIKPLFDDGLNLYKEKRYIAAKGIFEKLIEKYPASEYAKKALTQIHNCEDKILEDKFFRASSLYNEGSTKEAKEIFLEIINTYPESFWAKKAREKIEEIKD